MPSRDHEDEFPHPWFALAVTGHRDFIPGGVWTSRSNPSLVADVPGVRRVWRAIDAALAKRRGRSRISLFCRDGTAGVDHAVRFYAMLHGLPLFPLGVQRDFWFSNAMLRRDLELVGRTHGLLWFGEEETDGDPLCLSRLLGLPHQVVKESAENLE